MSTVTVSERFHVFDVVLFLDVGCCSVRESSCFDVMLFSVSVVTVPERLLVFDVMLFSGVSCHSAREVFCFLCDAVFGCRLSQCQRGFVFFHTTQPSYVLFTFFPSSLPRVALFLPLFFLRLLSC